MIRNLSSTIVNRLGGPGPTATEVLLMDNILHDLKDPKLWELWYIPYNG